LLEKTLKLPSSQYYRFKESLSINQKI